MNVIRLLAVALLAVVLSPSAMAQVYKWTDENGNVQYSEQKPETTQSTEITIKNETSALSTQCKEADSFEANGTTYCCTAKCVKERSTKKLPYTCVTQACFQAIVNTWSEPATPTQAAQPEQTNGEAASAAQQPPEKITLPESE